MKIIQLEKGRLLAVMVPDDTVHTGISKTKNGKKFLVYAPTDFKLNDRKEMPKGKWQPIGLSDQVTEKQAKMIVEAKYNLKYGDRNDMIGYRSYGKFHSDGNPYWLSSPLDSLHSLLRANEIYSVNPYPKCECKIFTKEFELCPNINSASTNCSLFEKHKIAQSNTSKWYLLFEPKEDLK